MFSMWRIVVAALVAACVPALDAAAQDNEALARGTRLFAAKDYVLAREVLSPLATANPANDSAAFLVGRIALRDHDLSAAARWLEKAVALRPMSSTYHHWLGRVYGQQAIAASMIRKAGIAGKSRNALERAVALDPGNLDARVDLAQFYAMAPGIVGGSKDKAKVHAREVIKRDELKGRLLSGFLQERAKNTAAAEREYRAAVNQYPDSVAAQYVLGLFYQRTGRPDDAIRTFENIVAREPAAKPALYYLGRSGALSGRNLERSEDVLKQYLEHTPAESDPPLSHAHLRLGMIYEREGLLDKAREEYRSSLKLDPGYKEAREALKKLGGR